MLPLNLLVMRFQGLPCRALGERYQLRHLLTPCISFVQPNQTTISSIATSAIGLQKRQTVSLRVFSQSSPVEIEFSMNLPRINDLNVSSLSELHALDAEFRTNGVSDCIGMMAHQWFGLGLDHDSRQRFSTGVADNDPARVRKISLGRANSGGNSRDPFERLLLANFHVDDDLRKHLEVADEFRQRSSTAVNDIKQQ